MGSIIADASMNSLQTGSRGMGPLVRNIKATYTSSLHQLMSLMKLAVGRGEVAKRKPWRAPGTRHTRGSSCCCKFLRPFAHVGASFVVT